MRLVYMGTPVDAVVPLRGLVDAGHDVALVVTQPDRRRSRGSGTVASPVKAAALDLGLPVLTPERAAEVIDAVRSSGADLGVVVAFGQILPDALLDALPYGFVNLHFSLLPRWRGAAPVERAILAGDTETGVCVMRVESGLDTGPIYACERLPIDPDTTAGELRHLLVAEGSRLLVEMVPRIPDTVATPQSGDPVYAAKLDVAEFRIDPAGTATELCRIVSAGSPRPGAWFTAGGSRVKVLRARVAAEGPPQGEVTLSGDAAVLGTGSGGLILVEVQREGRRPMSGAAWLAGRRGEAVLDAPADGAGA